MMDNDGIDYTVKKPCTFIMLQRGRLQITRTPWHKVLDELVMHRY